MIKKIILSSLVTCIFLFSFVSGLSSNNAEIIGYNFILDHGRVGKAGLIYSDFEIKLINSYTFADNHVVTYEVSRNILGVKKSRDLMLVIDNNGIVKNLYVKKLSNQKMF